MKQEGATLVLRVLCTKGTYIRVLAEDIGEALGCGAHLAGLRRTASGRFRIEQAASLEALAEPEERQPEDGPAERHQPPEPQNRAPRGEIHGATERAHACCRCPRCSKACRAPSWPRRKKRACAWGRL